MSPPPPIKNPANRLNKVKITIAPFRENVIFVGSEMHYPRAGFWNKMIFIASAFTVADRQRWRKADKNTIAYVDVGYTKAEKLPLELLRDNHGCNLVAIKSLKDVTTYLNNRPEHSHGGRSGKLLLQDVYFFCHGLPSAITLNLDAFPSITINGSTLSSIGANTFTPDGAIYSYACRTGNSASVLRDSFNNDDEAGPENSLAQKMANRFRVNVHAFLTRTWYGDVLRDKADSERISDALKEARKTQEGSIIQIPPDHEAFPHSGLSRGGLLSGTDEEGTNEYALWRKKGAICMPSADDTPRGLTQEMRLFAPKM